MASEQGHTDDLEQLWTEVEDAVDESLNNADGRVSKFYLEYYFMKAGLGVFRLPDDPVGLQAAAPDLLKVAEEVVRIDGFISMHEMFARDWEPLAKAARAALTKAQS